jgi:hypothetical protein
MVVDIYKCWMIHILADHLRKKVTQETDKSFDILLACKKDFFSSYSRLP